MLSEQYFSYMYIHDHNQCKYNIPCR